MKPAGPLGTKDNPCVRPSAKGRTAKPCTKTCVEPKSCWS